MSKYLYSDDTTPVNAAQISADTGEIVHVQCRDLVEAKEYSVQLRSLLDDSDTTGSCGGGGELETFGDLDGHPVRVHVCLA